MTETGSGNLADEFEQAFKACLASLTNPDHLNIVDSEETKTGVEQTIHHFLDVAKQMECFFLQKRLLFSVQKPELIVREDIMELKAELSRKEQLLQRHYEKIGYWQNLLSELQGAPRSANQQSHSQGPMTSAAHPQNHPPPPPPPPNMPQNPQPPLPPTSHTPNIPQRMSPQIPYPNQGHPVPSLQSQTSGLQGPLAYLEQTTSNIGITDHPQR